MFKDIVFERPLCFSFSWTTDGTILNAKMYVNIHHAWLCLAHALILKAGISSIKSSSIQHDVYSVNCGPWIIHWDVANL